jgi:riboflavin kinase / FMN adenylyltransferase
LIVKLIRQLLDIRETDRHGAVAIGNFDGVHRGHAQLVRRLVAHARRVDGPAVIFTFEPHPVRLLRPQLAPPPLTWTERKATLLAELGVDALIAYPTDEDLLALSPEAFFSQIVKRTLAARAVVEGPNFYFGKDRAGDVSRLRTLCAAQQIELEVVPPLEQDGETISSSRVRQLLAAGQIEQATRMLTQPYRIRGMVTHGAARGHQLGFPTANIDAVDTLIPALGVYGGRGFAAGDRWPAAIHIGPNPTFGEHAVKIEVHLIGFAGTLYGDPLEVDFLARLRDIHTFASVEQLLTQLRLDVDRAAEVCRQYDVR